MASSALSYAAQLKPNDNKGPCGDAQIFDTPADINRKFNKFFTLFCESKNALVHTGAGVSTAAGIPDFRGPSGVWTVMSMQEKSRNKRRKMTDGDCTVKDSANLSVVYGNSKLESVEFTQAMPSVSHLVILALLRSGHIKSIITQNIDGLHAISGVKHSECSEVHGNVFVERCIFCGRRFLRPYVSPTISFKPTGNHCGLCSFPPCGILTDVVLDWFDRYEDHFEKRALAYAEGADLHLTLGSSLHVEPACLYASSEHYRQEEAPLIIVNYQKTRMDAEADVVMHCDVNLICKKLLKRLNIPMPVYIRHFYMTGMHYCQNKENKVLLRFPCIIDITIWEKQKATGNVLHRCLNIDHGLHEFSFSSDFEIVCSLWFDAEMKMRFRYVENCPFAGFVWKLSLAASNGPLTQRKNNQVLHTFNADKDENPISVTSVKLAYNASLIGKAEVCNIVAVLSCETDYMPGFTQLAMPSPIPTLLGFYNWLLNSGETVFGKVIGIKTEDAVSELEDVEYSELLPEIMRLCIKTAIDMKLGCVVKGHFSIDMEALVNLMRAPHAIDNLFKPEDLKLFCAVDHQLGEMVSVVPTECKVCLPRRIRPIVPCRSTSINALNAIFTTVLKGSLIDIFFKTVRSQQAYSFVNLFVREFPKWVVTFLTDTFECR